MAITDVPAFTHLTEADIENLGNELDAIHDEVFGELGDRDRRYITSMIDMHRRLVVLARVLLFASRYRPAWIGGTATEAWAICLTALPPIPLSSLRTSFWDFSPLRIASRSRSCAATPHSKKAISSRL